LSAFIWTLSEDEGVDEGEGGGGIELDRVGVASRFLWLGLGDGTFEVDINGNSCISGLRKPLKKNRLLRLLLRCRLRSFDLLFRLRGFFLDLLLQNSVSVM